MTQDTRHVYLTQPPPLQTGTKIFVVVVVQIVAQSDIRQRRKRHSVNSHEEKWMKFQGRQLFQNCKIVLLPSEKWSILKGKNLLPLGANSFLLEWTHFQKGLGVQERKSKVTRVVSLV